MGSGGFGGADGGGGQAMSCDLRGGGGEVIFGGVVFYDGVWGLDRGELETENPGFYPGL